MMPEAISRPYELSVVIASMIAAIKAGNVAELALIRAARRELDVGKKIFSQIDQLVGRNREFRHVETDGGRQHDLLRRPRWIARQPRDQIVSGIAEFADVKVI